MGSMPRSISIAQGWQDLESQGNEAVKVYNNRNATSLRPQIVDNLFLRMSWLARGIGLSEVVVSCCWMHDDVGRQGGLPPRWAYVLFKLYHMQNHELQRSVLGIRLSNERI